MRPIDLSAFPKEREEKLRAILRYSLFDVMLYRASVWDHVQRVSWIVEELARYSADLNIDIERARVLALVHDDAEMITGDYQAGHKAKMSKDELQKLDVEEERAAKKLAATYPKMVHGYEYESLLLHSLRKDCDEALLVMYADKFDAYNETLHEVLAGNYGFVWSLMFYEQWFAKYLSKYPRLHRFAAQTSPFILGGDNRHQPQKVIRAEYVGHGTPHTKESVKTPSGFAFYNAWRELILRLDSRGERFLTEQKEFLQQK